MGVRDEIRELPGFIVLGRRNGANAWQGVVELSFSMGLSPDDVRYWWTGRARTFLGSFDIDGRAMAEDIASDFSTKHRDMTFEIFDPRSDECPVHLDWDDWVEAMLIGERQKYRARNPRFTMDAPESVG